jgi:hypothetical protein
MNASESISHRRISLIEPAIESSERGYLRDRVSQFTALPIERLDKLSLTNRLREIGALDGAAQSPQQVN